MDVCRGDMREGFWEEEGSEPGSKGGETGCAHGSGSGRPLKEMGQGDQRLRVGSTGYGGSSTEHRKPGRKCSRRK